MITLRKSGERGHFNHGWLDTRHTFSFADYHDPHHMGFHSLRVLNEDRVRPGEGFGTHGHRDMEILTWVLEGALEHKDSMGTVGVLKPGDLQRMSAGTGIMHSEYNGSQKEPVHFLQIWILPRDRGIQPRYEQKHFPAAERTNALRLLASPDGRDGSLSLNQDAHVYTASLEPGREVAVKLAPGRSAWVQVARGQVDLGHGFSQGKDGMECAGEWTGLSAGDGAAVSEEARLALRSDGEAELLFFDLK